MSPSKPLPCYPIHRRHWINTFIGSFTAILIFSLSCSGDNGETPNEVTTTLPGDSTDTFGGGGNGFESVDSGGGVSGSGAISGGGAPLGGSGGSGAAGSGPVGGGGGLTGLDGGISGDGGPLCGNGLIEAGEECDGDNLGGESCQSMNLGSGQLTCNSACHFDVNGCDGTAGSGGYGGDTAGAGGAGPSTGQGGTGGISVQEDPVCEVPDPSEYQANMSIGGGGTNYRESDHFIVFNASNPENILNFMEAAHKCFVQDWCWRDAGLSIHSDDGPYYKYNIYSMGFMGAGGYMQTDHRAGITYVQVLSSMINQPQYTVHEYGHALTYSAQGWIEQKNTGFWWETVAQWVADTFLTSHLCADARNQFSIPEGRTITELDRVYNLSHTVICNDQNYYQNWPFLTYLTNNPDNYPGIGRMTLPDMWRTHQGNNETPIHQLERMAAPVTAQTILGRYWARMAYLYIGHPQAQEAFLSSRNRLDFAANLDSAGNQNYRVRANRQPQYGGANITPLNVTGNGDVSIQVTNLGNGLTESNFTATLAIRSSDGAVRYVDLPGGAGQATVGNGEEASLVVVNTPDTLYMYDPQFVGRPENVGLNYEVQITGAVPSN